MIRSVNRLSFCQDTMSIKRQATTDLNHENWDQEDPSEHEEMGSFKTAPKDVLEKRVIRTAKRRTQASASDAKKGGVFSGFGGFNKAAPPSFDFLANLTNGNKTSGSPSNENAVFGTKSSTMLNSPMMTSSPNAKSTFGMPSSQTSSVFGSSTTSAPAASLFSSKADCKSESPFKIQTLNSPDSNSRGATETTNTLTSQPSTTIFGGISAGSKQSLFTSSSSTSFKIQATLGATTTNNFGSSSNKKEESNDDKKLKYYSKLKGLNESVSDWIKKHVEETPLCILTPIFKDYEKYLKDIQEEYEGSKEESKKPIESKAEETKSINDNVLKSTSGSPGSVSGSTLFPNTSTPNKTSVFGSHSNAASDKPSGFSFGVTPATATNASNNSSGTTSGFTFGINSAQTTQAATTSLFSASSNATNTNGGAPFSFGTGKPFSFSSSNVKQNTEQTTENNEEDDEPPKVEYTPVVEENSIFDKKCKIFVKKDGNFVDKGVGTLYIKKIEDSGKHQLLVRANTSLGNVLLNLILSASIPTQRLGKNNVMMVCIPTPEAKPPPTPVLIRVKTSDEADALLETINKHKI